MYFPNFRKLNDTPEDTGGTTAGAAPVADEPEFQHTPMDQDAFEKLFDDDDASGDGATAEGKQDESQKEVAPVNLLAPEASAKPADKVDDKPKLDDLAEPEGLSERAKGRWATLAERAKQVPELSTKLSEAQEQIANVRSMVNESRLAPEEFTNLLSLGKLYKSTEPQELKQALAQLDDLREDLAMRMGVEVAGVDPLAKFKDLQAEVDDMAISRKRAIEIAHFRTNGKRTQQQTAASQQQQAAVQKMESAAMQTESALAARASMPGHDAKVAYIKNYLANPANKAAFVKNYQPEQWAAATMMMYEAYTPPAPAAKEVRPLRSAGTQHGAPARQGATSFETIFNDAYDRVID